MTVLIRPHLAYVAFSQKDYSTLCIHKKNKGNDSGMIFGVPGSNFALKEIIRMRMFDGRMNPLVSTDPEGDASG